MDEMTKVMGATLLSGGCLNIVGRPGTGETTLLESLYSHLVAQVDPSSVLVLTADRDHADVLRNRLEVPTAPVLSAAPARSVSALAYGAPRPPHASRAGA